MKKDKNINNKQLENNISDSHLSLYNIIEKKLASLKEDEFRVNILIPLFREKGYQNVRDNHSARELGKDIIMWKNDDIFGKLNYAVVIKAGKITGKVNGNDSFSIVETQVKLALNSKINDEKTFEEQLIHKCIIANNQPIKKEAIDALYTVLSEKFKSKQIIFYNYNDIISDIIKYGIIQPNIEDIVSMYNKANQNRIFKIQGIKEIDGETVVDLKVDKNAPLEKTKIDLSFKFNNDVEGRELAKKMQDFKEHGLPVEIPGKYIKIDAPDFTNEMGSNIISKIIIGEIKEPNIYYCRLEIKNDNGNIFYIPYLEFKKQFEGEKSYTIFCDFELLAFNISIREEFDKIHFNYSLKKDLSKYTMYQMLISAEFNSAISKGGSVNLYDLKSNICVLKFDIEPDSSHDDYFLELFRKAAFIQQATKKELYYTENELSNEDIYAINELYTILTTGYKKSIIGTFTFYSNNINYQKKYTSSDEIQDFFFMFQKHDIYYILGKEIDLGIACYFVNKGILKYQMLSKNNIEIKITTNKDCPAHAYYEKYLNKKRRPSLNFIEMGIPIGARLVFSNNDIISEVFVSSEKKVKEPNCNEEKSLSQITKELLKIDYNIHPTRYWSYEGKSLHDYYNETYTFVD